MPSDWPEQPPGDDVDGAPLGALLTRAFDEPPGALGVTLAAVVIHRGVLVAERYGPDAAPDEPLISWSTAKSVTHALIGLLVADGRLTLDDPAPVPRWHAAPDDPRAAITVRHLLHMTDGLDFVEDYVDDGVSHVIDMLFGAGKDDVYAYAASRPAAHAPGTWFNYSSGTTDILCGIGRDLLGGEGPTRDLLQCRLFDPIGMRSASPRFDAAGTFVGSSFLDATARDFARFAELYRLGGTWEGTEVLPADWVELAHTPIPVPTREEMGYGAHWWLWPDVDGCRGVFAAHGYEGQYLVVDRAREIVLVRLGKTPAELRPNVVAWMRAVLRCFPPAA